MTPQQLPESLARAVSALGHGAARAFVVELAMESQAGSPVDTGRFRASWRVSAGSPAFAGLGPGQGFPLPGRALFDAALSSPFTAAHLTNDAATGRNSYAFVIDRGRRPRDSDGVMSGSLQAPLGVSQPAAIRAAVIVLSKVAQIERAAS